MRQVFISYASGDTDWPEPQVVEVADSLRSRGVTVHLDVWHRQALRRKASPSEWLKWMNGCLAQDPLVLCLGSTTYSDRFDSDNDVAPAGKGVAFESVQVLRRLYNTKQRNEGWLWFAIRDGAVPDQCLPDLVAFQCPLYCCPSEADALFADLAYHALQGPLPAASSSATSTDAAQAGPVALAPALPTQPTLVAQTQWAADRLAEAPGLLAQLRRDHWGQRPPACLAKGDAGQLAAWLCSADAGDCDTTLMATRRALGKVPVKPDRETRLAAERAAVALYCLAACRRVSLAAGALHGRGGLVSVPSDAHVYCAVIATVLSGGRLELQASPQHPGLPGPAYAFDVQGAATGDGASYAFDRAVYAAVFPHAERTTYFTLDHSPLSRDELTQLRARLKTLRSVKEQSVTLVVRLACARDQADAFGIAHALPVFICDPQLAKDVLGVDADELVNDLAEFWRELIEFPSQPAPPANPPPLLRPSPSPDMP